MGEFIGVERESKIFIFHEEMLIIHDFGDSKKMYFLIIEGYRSFHFINLIIYCNKVSLLQYIESIFSEGLCNYFSI